MPSATSGLYYNRKYLCQSASPRLALAVCSHKAHTKQVEASVHRNCDGSNYSWPKKLQGPSISSTWAHSHSTSCCILPMFVTAAKSDSQTTHLSSPYCLGLPCFPKIRTCLPQVASLSVAHSEDPRSKLTSLNLSVDDAGFPWSLGSSASCCNMPQLMLTLQNPEKDNISTNTSSALRSTVFCIAKKAQEVQNSLPFYWGRSARLI